jgi:GT2 family glycosyltransferase
VWGHSPYSVALRPFPIRQRSIVSFVSFIIPVLNGEKEISRCLASIQQQRFSPDQYEVIVLDNGSNDKTLEIVRDFRVNLQVLPGISVAALRNKGAEIARGDYLAFVDSDVELIPQWLCNGLVVFKNDRVVAAGCFPRTPRPSSWVQQVWELHQRGGRQQENVKSVAWLPSMNLLVRRDKFFEIGGFNAELATAEDVDLCYRLSELGIILCTPAMDAIHWGEARDLPTFWRKEVWRGKSNLKGVLAHGLRWDEVPSIGYPLYIIALLFFLCLNCIVVFKTQELTLIAMNLMLLTLPALGLATATSWRTKRFDALPKLIILYFVYGIARAFSIAKACVSARPGYHLLRQ